MEVRVLVVDDSVFYRHRVVAALNAEKDMVVVGEASNGMEAVEKARLLRPDVIIMDVSMPVMDGVTAVRKIMEDRPTHILMFSSLTTKGAQATFDALDAGAVDFMTKHLEELSGDPQQALRHLCRRVHMFGSSSYSRERTASNNLSHRADAAVNALPKRPPYQVRQVVQKDREGAHVQLVVIGTSTGGPVALQKLLSMLPNGYGLPVLVVQHMPPSFTKAFAERLNKLCSCNVKEAQDGERLERSTIYIAPGGYQTSLKRGNESIYIQVKEPSSDDIYRPSVDVAFSSAASVLPGGVLGVVLTGMGSDGRDGAGMLKSVGCKVWVQDEASSVIFGMPKAVLSAGYADQVLSLQDLGKSLSGLA